MAVITTINNTTESSQNTNGALIVKGGLGVKKNIRATKVFNAVWNDIADFIEIGEDTEIVYGKAYFRNKSGDIYITDRKRASLGIASDTYGFGVGEDSRKRQIPIAIGGWVLAYVKKAYKAETPLVAGKNGILVRARLKDRVLHPERIIAIFDRAEEDETWNGVEVKGRHWVKVK